MPRRCRVAIVGLITLATLATLAACNDVRDFRGGWAGTRVGDTAAVHVGITGDPGAALTITAIDKLGLTGTLDVEGLIRGAAVTPLAGAEADRLSSLSFDGAPLRIYLSFVATTDGFGDVLAMIAIYDDERIEIRLLRGGDHPVYAIFDLAR